MANILFVTWDGGGNLPLQPLALPPSCNDAAKPYGSLGMSSSAPLSNGPDFGSSRTRSRMGSPARRRSDGCVG